MAKKVQQPAKSRKQNPKTSTLAITAISELQFQRWESKKTMTKASKDTETTEAQSIEENSGKEGDEEDREKERDEGEVMFVKWKKYGLRLAPGNFSLTAVLVDSRRVNGKPRHKIICTLATIKERDICGCGYGRYGSGSRKPFWSRIERWLDILGLAPEDRAKIGNMIARRVPQWTPEDEERLAAANRASFEIWREKQAEKRRRREEQIDEERFQQARVVPKSAIV